jgi:selenocysteine lyase/cysteine desulfurase
MTIYLDNAATSWPKPEAVYRAVDDFLRDVGATPGRGGHRREEEALRITDEARQAMARLFAAPDPQAINMALKRLLRPGDHAVTSSIEHNAVWRPLKALEHQGVTVTAVSCAPDGTLNPAEVEAALRPDTRLVAMLHASNVLGTILPIGDVGQICHDRGILFLVDAAQTAGAYPIDMEARGSTCWPSPGTRAPTDPTAPAAGGAARHRVGDVGRGRVGHRVGLGDDARAASRAAGGGHEERGGGSPGCWQGCASC